MKLPFPDVFDELLFLYAFSFSLKSVSSSHHRTNTHNVGVLNSPNQISSKWILITSRLGLTWNADMWLINLPKTACATLSPIQMSNQIAKFNTWKLIAARWILRQHNINVIATYFKYLVQQFNLTSEWDLISAVSSNSSGVPVFWKAYQGDKSLCSWGV